MGTRQRACLRRACTPTPPTRSSSTRTTRELHAAWSSLVLLFLFSPCSIQQPFFLRSVSATSARGIPYRGWSPWTCRCSRFESTCPRVLHHGWPGARSPYKDVHPIVERLGFWAGLAHKSICGSGIHADREKE